MSELEKNALVEVIGPDWAGKTDSRGQCGLIEGGGFQNDTIIEMGWAVKSLNDFAHLGWFQPSSLRRITSLPNPVQIGRPQPGDIWILRRNKDRYKITDLGQQKEGDRQWHDAVFYRSVGTGFRYSRRTSSFLEAFYPEGEPTVSSGAQVFQPGDRVGSTDRWGEGTVLGPTSAEGRYRVKYDCHPGVFAVLPSQLRLLERR